MNPTLRATPVLLLLFAGATFALAGPFHTKVITPTSDPVVLNLAENVFFQVKNFTQEGGTARGTVAVTIDGQTVNVLTASQINATSVAVVPEFINRITIAGPATVTIDPVADATLTITYRKLRQGAPITPTPAPTPTPTPTATPTPTP